MRGGIASMLGRYFGLSSDRVKALLPVGASAAVAAAFRHASSRGSIFARVHRRSNAPVLGSVVLASAASWLMLRLLLVITRCFRCHNMNGASSGVRHHAVLGVVGGLCPWFYKIVVKNAGIVPEPTEKTPSVSACCWWFARRTDGSFRAAVGCWLWVCRRRAKWKDGARISAVLVVLKLLAVTTS